MPAQCERCGKSVHSGFSVSHSKRHTHRRWLPNLQKVRLLMNGQLRRLRLCTRCLRSALRLKA
ncbi:MAG: 50S ribosomal protein L28 [Dehalococcoidia bacterium]|nr:50S ribosomal protein L28 [Dehalococcoidia bacterium]